LARLLELGRERYICGTGGGGAGGPVAMGCFAVGDEVQNWLEESYASYLVIILKIVESMT